MKNNLYITGFLSFIFVIVLIIPFKANAQQEPSFMQYMHNTVSYNPAYAGTKDMLNGIMQSRIQWAGFDGAPQTHLFSANSPAPIYEDQVGLGFSYMNDRNGPLAYNNMFLSYSYRMIIHHGGMISFGLSTGLEVRNIDLADLNPLDPNDPTYNFDKQTHTSMNFGTGIYYYTDDYYAGLSIPKLRKVNYYPEKEVGNEVSQRHVILTGGYVWDFDQYWNFKPSLKTKYVKGMPPSVDINISAAYQERIIGGISHRIGDAIGLMIQLQAYKYLWVGYGFDFSITNIRHHNYGTHEIALFFDFDIMERIRGDRPSFRFF